jgi:hypothetical protein
MQPNGARYWRFNYRFGERQKMFSAAYNHALYLEPRARMMQAWADHPDVLRRQLVSFTSPQDP